MEWIYRLFRKMGTIPSELFDYLRNAQGQGIRMENGQEQLVDFYSPYGSQTFTFFLICLGVAMLLFALYYYVIKTPSLARPWKWLVACGLSFVLAFVVCFLVIRGQDSDIAAYVDAMKGEGVSAYIGNREYLNFGLANGVIALVLFLVLTLVQRLCLSRVSGLGNTTCRYMPF